MEGSSSPPPQPPAPDNRPHVSPPHAAALHSVNKPPAKPWQRPMPRPARVYHVRPRGFRQLVQRLTGAPPSSASHRPLASHVIRPLPLQLAPPMLPRLPRPPPAFEHGGLECDLGGPSAQGGRTAPPSSNEEAGTGPTELLSPSDFSEWYSKFPILSPGTMAAAGNGNSNNLQTSAGF